MSKKNTEKATEYLNALAQENKLDDATKANLLKVLENEGVANALGEGFLRHDEFSNQMDGFKKSQEEFEGEKKLQKDWYGGAVTTFEANKARSAELQTTIDERDVQLQAYRDSYGDPPNAGTHGTNGTNGAGNNPPFDTSKFMTVDAHEKALRERDASIISVVKGANRLSMDHYMKFGTQLDMDALEKIAVEKGLPLNAAYSELIAPQVAEQQKTARDEDLKKAKEEGRQEAMRDHNMPTDDTPSAPHVIHDAMKPEDAPEGAGREAFLAGMRETAGKGA